MNYLKQLVILLLPLVLITACSNDEELNTGTATVAFQSSEIEIEELSSSLKIPVIATGEHNGLIRVRIEIQENNSGFENDKDILITDTQLLMPVGFEKVEVEALLSIANDEFRQGRSFSIAIVEVEGAEIGTNAVCKVNIKENSPLEGKYTMEGRSQLQSPSGITGYDCTLSAVDDTYRQLYLDFGQGGSALVEVEPTTNEGEYKLTIAADQLVGTYNGNNVMLIHKTVSNGRWVDTSEPITGIFKDKTVIFETNHALGLQVPADGGYLWLIGSYTDESGHAVPLKLIKQ